MKLKSSSSSLSGSCVVGDSTGCWDWRSWSQEGIRLVLGRVNWKKELGGSGVYVLFT